MSALLILALFVGFAALMYARIMPALIAVPLMAIAMSLGAGVPFLHLAPVVTLGAIALAPVYVTVIFGALLGRVTLDTGIARAMVNLAAEYGGENPVALTLGLCAVVALLFTSLSGLGAIIMVGSIVLPVLMTSGVPRTIAATAFLLSFALGFIFNLTNWTFYTKYFGVPPERLVHYAIVLAMVDAAALVAYVLIAFRRERGYATWAVRSESSGDDEPLPHVPAIALATPLLPLVLYYAFHVEAAPAFLIAALYGVLATRPREAISTLMAAAIRGVEDVAPAILLFVGIGMLLVAVKQPEFAAALQPLAAGGWIANPVLYVVVFGLFSPLVLYRGPLNPFGVGIAIFTVLLASNVVPPVILVAAIMAVVQVQNVCDPTNTANVWVANFTGVPIATITKRTLPFQVAVAVLATLAVVTATPALFGLRAFASPIPAARADAESPPAGFFAPAGARGRVAIGNDGTPLGQAAGQAVAGALRDRAFDTFALQDDPNASDCARKPYAAYVQVSTSRFSLIEGTDLDVGLRLEDCGGWIVSEWHDHRVLPQEPTVADAQALALEGAARLRAWTNAEPVRSANLFAGGAAYKPGDAPSYFYTLFKTIDGNMRLYVRGGGPAYAAGLRSGDVVDKLDGKYWWEYGTFQTQLRAYDGKPHAFEIERNGKKVDVQLGSPYQERLL